MGIERWWRLYSRRMPVGSLGNQGSPAVFLNMASLQMLELAMTTKTKSKFNPEAVDRLDLPLWGAKEIAVTIRRTERATRRLLDLGMLPATKIGGHWTSTPRRLLGRFEGKAS
jgi:hypothetical protein